MNIRPLQITLAILKPDVVAHPHIVKDIRSMILKHGFLFVKSKKLHLSPVKAADFYEEHKGKFFVNRLVSFMSRLIKSYHQKSSCMSDMNTMYIGMLICLSSGPVWTHILAREAAIPEWRQLMGATKVLKTIYEDPESIRGKYGLTDTRNCAHGSDSEETAKREIQFFFPEFDVSKWYQETEPLFRSGQVRFDEEKVEHVPVLQNGTAGS
ncbi:hypothetical protein BaRGS_00004663 [Batillaria attramentaria]|uniref:Nucleoside diphosphate kinase n=1 Tax=Batillaria attramentaria TaxID=370345 RepID=A0ABD0LXK1_9CAEN